MFLAEFSRGPATFDRATQHHEFLEGHVYKLANNILFTNDIDLPCHHYCAAI